MDMGIAIVCMTNHTAVRLLHEQKNYSMNTIYGLANFSSLQTNTTPVPDIVAARDCPVSLNSKLHEQDGEFVYTEKEKGLILSAYFYGSIITQVKKFDYTSSERSFSILNIF